MQKAFISLLIAAVLLIMLVLDLHLPVGVIHGMPYVVLISVSYWLPWRRAPMVLAVISTLLIVVGYLYSPEHIDTTALLLNVGLEAAVLWVTAYLVLRLMGYERLRLYPAGWSEWTQDATRPLGKLTIESD